MSGTPDRDQFLRSYNKNTSIEIVTFEDKTFSYFQSTTYRIKVSGQQILFEIDIDSDHLSYFYTALKRRFPTKK